jgi:hypothetical protein
MSLFKKLVSTSLFCATAFLSFAQAEAPVLKIANSKVDWQKFTSKENGFSVDFPTTPDHVEQKIDIPKSDLSIKYETFLSEPNENAVYVVSVWYYPSEIDMSKPEVNLKDGFEGMLSALPGAKVEKMNITDLNGFKALEFRVKHDEIYFQGKLILVYNTLYQVFTVYKENVDVKDDFNRFINSFKLQNPEKNRLPSKNEKGKEVPRKMNVMLEKF